MLQSAEERRVLFSSLLTPVPEIVSCRMKFFAITIDKDFFVRIDADQRCRHCVMMLADFDAGLNAALEWCFETQQSRVDSRLSDGCTRQAL